jgi:PAS domain S-box-containing protein
MSEGAFHTLAPSTAGSESLRLLLEGAPIAIVTLDAQHRITALNARADSLFGYEREELVGGPFEQLVPAGGPAHAVGTRDVFGVRKDGSTVPIELGLSTISTPAGDIVMAAITDVTERKRAEDRLWAVIEGVPTATILVDDDGLVVMTNAEAQRLFGYERGELLGKSAEMLVPVRFRNAPGGWRQHFLTPSLRTIGAARELYGLRKDGTEVPIEIGLNPLELGESRFMLAAITDITERKRAEERLRAVIEAAPSATVLVDGSGRVAMTNAEAERLFGYRREELLGQSVERLLPQQFRKIHVVQRDGYLAKPTKRSMGAGRDLFGLRKDGTEIPIEIGLNPLHLGDSRYVLASIIDITERKRGEKLRKLTAEFGQRALGAAHSGRLKHEAAELIARVTGAPFVRIGEVDPDGTQITFNAGVGWPKALTEDHVLPVALSPQAAETIRAGQPVIVDAPGAKFPPSEESAARGIVGSATVPIRTKGAVVGLINVGFTTHQKFSQDNLSFLLGVGTILGMAIERDRREQRIEQLNVELQHRYGELETFSYSVAHDLRAPLRAVSGFASALEEDYAEMLDAEAKRYIGLIVGGATQMGHLIDALLELSRLSRQEITLAEVDVTGMARSIVSELHGMEPERNVVATVEPNLTAAADPALLRNVVQNLLGNAWKFTRGRDPALIRFEAKKVNGQTVFSISDNGVGFKTEYPEEIFAPFKRLHGKTFEGTGIGLATVARIVARHGGRVWAESEPGAGATFFFTLGPDGA